MSERISLREAARRSGMSGPVEYVIVLACLVGVAACLALAGRMMALTLLAGLADG
jgi:hypothetical protein